MRVSTGSLASFALIALAFPALGHHATAWEAARAGCFALPNFAPPGMVTPQQDCLNKIGPKPAEPARSITSGGTTNQKQGTTTTRRLTGAEVYIPGDVVSSSNVNVKATPRLPKPDCASPNCVDVEVFVKSTARLGVTTITHKLPNHSNTATWTVDVRPIDRIESTTVSVAPGSLIPQAGGSLSLVGKWNVWGNTSEVGSIEWCEYQPDNFSWPSDKAIAAGCRGDGECDGVVANASSPTATSLPDDPVKGPGKQYSQSFTIAINAAAPAGTWKVRCNAKNGIGGLLSGYTTFTIAAPRLMKMP